MQHRKPCTSEACGPVHAETAGSDADSEEEALPDWGSEKTEKPPLKLGKVSLHTQLRHLKALASRDIQLHVHSAARVLHHALSTSIKLNTLYFWAIPQIDFHHAQHTAHTGNAMQWLHLHTKAFSML